MKPKLLSLAVPLLSLSLFHTPVRAQCVTSVTLRTEGGPTGGALCVAIVPIGFARSSALQPGCSNRYVIKPGDGASGNWDLLDLGPCIGGACGGNSTSSSRFECQLAYGSGCRIDRVVSTLPGARRGAVRDGMQARFDSDTDQRMGLCFDDYQGNGRRLMVLPVTAPFENGRSQIEVQGFAVFFLTRLPNDGSDDIEAEYLYDVPF